MSKSIFLCAALMCLSFGSASAADLDVKVVDQDGKPVANAVVMIYPASGISGAAVNFPWKYQMSQRDIRFSPEVLIVPQGASVGFPNFDRVRHHVYSFSHPNDFELKLYGREDNRSVSFAHVGTVAMGCNIHDEMSGFIKVVDTPYVGKSEGDGMVRLTGLPDGASEIAVWHPYIVSKTGEFRAKLDLPSASKRIKLSLDRP